MSIESTYTFCKTTSVRGDVALCLYLHWCNREHILAWIV